MLLLEDPGRERLGRVVVEDGHRALQHDRPGVAPRVHQVHRAPRDLDAVRPRLPLGVEAGEARQQRRVDVDDALREARDERRREQPHVAGEADPLAPAPPRSPRRRDARAPRAPGPCPGWRRPGSRARGRARARARRADWRPRARSRPGPRRGRTPRPARRGSNPAPTAAPPPASSPPPALPVVRESWVVGRALLRYSHQARSRRRNGCHFDPRATTHDPRSVRHGALRRTAPLRPRRSGR